MGGGKGDAFVSSLKGIAKVARMCNEINRLLGGFMKACDRSLVIFRSVGDGTCLRREVAFIFSALGFDCTSEEVPRRAVGVLRRTDIINHRDLYELTDTAASGNYVCSDDNLLAAIAHSLNATIVSI